MKSNENPILQWFENKGWSLLPFQKKAWKQIHDHLHPKVEISNRYDRLVLRCFQIFSDLAILPAFGFFVGGTLVKKREDCKIYVVADDSVIEI